MRSPERSDIQQIAKNWRDILGYSLSFASAHYAWDITLRIRKEDGRRVDQWGVIPAVIHWVVFAWSVHQFMRLVGSGVGGLLGGMLRQHCGQE